ncbi:uncharacterized protein LOC117505435 [Thalassophryne amazonica]|uniref:uncharacterized protein LOC117505435 n=1 Tax=Thalassophryne amazonica TaxID=390379 RepID=UPI001471DC62|nr:uncharacterized protein LOC117505435 [Thalassophryne amazonica]
MKTLTYVCLLICVMMTLSGAADLPEGEQLKELQKEVRVKRSSSCPSGWYKISGRCFRYVPRAMTWARAERNCLHMGGHLTSVNSDDEYHDIQNMIKKITYQNSEAWLGGSDAQEEGLWFWSDGKSFGYNSWCPGEPNNHGNQHCLAINHSGQKCWDDRKCEEKHPSVCAKTYKRFRGLISQLNQPSILCHLFCRTPTVVGVELGKREMNAGPSLTERNPSSRLRRQLNLHRGYHLGQKQHCASQQEAALCFPVGLSINAGKGEVGCVNPYALSDRNDINGELSASTSEDVSGELSAPTADVNREPPAPATEDVNGEPLVSAPKDIGGVGLEVPIPLTVKNTGGPCGCPADSGVQRVTWCTSAPIVMSQSPFMVHLSCQSRNQPPVSPTNSCQPWSWTSISPVASSQSSTRTPLCQVLQSSGANLGLGIGYIPGQLSAPTFVGGQMFQPFRHHVLGTPIFQDSSQWFCDLPEGEQLNEPQEEVRVKRSSSCPRGWSEISGHCFSYVAKPLTWKNAERNCMSMGGHLASVHSYAEYLDIQNLIIKVTRQPSQPWLGGSETYEEGHWLWSDGTPFGYNNWCPGEPNNGVFFSQYSQDCLQMNHSAQKCWDDDHCFHIRPSICAKPPTD